MKQGITCVRGYVWSGRPGSTVCVRKRAQMLLAVYSLHVGRAAEV